MQGLLIVCVLFLAGCGQPQALPKDVVAKVNNYMITADEFKRALDTSRAVLRDYPDLAPSLLKEKVLEDMIVNQLLLEEAQKLDFDKQQVFMREVEGYWRQALLKSLIQSKNKEFLEQQPVGDDKLRALYERQGHQLELTIMSFADEATAREGVAARAISQDTGWWMSGDLPEDVEEAIWGLKVGEVSKPIVTAADGWLVVKVISREKVEQKPFDAMTGALRKRLAAHTTQAMMDRWIGQLRARADIVKDQALIDRVEFGKK